MSGSATSDKHRQRGSVRQRGNSLQVRVYAGVDPVTGKPNYLTETIKGTDKAAHRRASKVMTKLQARVDAQRSPSSSVSFSHAVDEWLRTADIEDTTRHGYVGYIERSIRPVLGDLPVNKITARTLETFYGELRRCRLNCDGRPFVEHRAEGEHDCAEKKCAPHQCKGMAASTVRQVHSIISGVLNAAVRWDWISSNPARIAQRPKQTPPQPDPPSPAQAAKLVDKAFELDEAWGTLVWLAMTTGMRRGEVCALRWSRVDLDEGIVEVRSSYTTLRGVGREKDTKTHQMRRIALDTETIVLLREHKNRCDELARSFGLPWSEDFYVFHEVSGDLTKPYSPESVSNRYKKMAKRLDIDTHFHALRHYSATELLTAGIDLRTVAGRLGHGGGGATTLRVYAAWVAAADRKAAEILGSRMPKVSRK
ncbi:Site-specific recombinase XerD [Amycolatopsis arida]|uniref:Site-specific recombinase XerD n=1 Tax=Amycolatopsis arida TaxID=587909 RepID=A0A1I5V1V9_9PSEU|nr:site-specific integrase [Amycolatopsis arida]TDX91116.1 site-specific recombinase XerD [Amycolatopsis arida]SFQ01469.1 Site-specific recombinase XerD [Amycolatopsis arida]